MIENLETVLDKLNALNYDGRYQEALADVKMLLLQEQEESALYVVKGYAEYGLGNFTQALDDFETAISLNPDDINARTNYALALFELGRYVDGLNAADSALFLDDTFAAAYVNGAHCLAALGHIDMAIEYVQAAINTNAQDGDIVAHAATILNDLDAYEAARDAFMRAASLPTPPEGIHAKIADFFEESRQKGVDRGQISRDIDAWRTTFANNPEVFELVSRLLRA